MITITDILKTFENDLWKSSELLKPVAIQLLGWFFMFELTTGLLESKPGTNPLEILIDKMKRWAYLYAFIYFFDKAVELIEQVFDYFLTIATNKPTVDFAKIPQNMLSTAINSVFGLIDYIEVMSPTTWFLFVGVIIGLFVFGMVIFSVSMALMEYFIVKSLLIVLVPFMMFKKLSFVGEKVVGTLINLNMKLFLIKFVYSYFEKFLSQPLVINEKGLPLIASTVCWLMCMAVLGLTATKANELAATLITGSSTFGDGSQLANFAKTSVIGMAAKAYKAARGTAKAGHSAGKGAMAGAKAGYQKGISGSLEGMKAGYNASGGSKAQEKGRGIYADIGGASGFAGGIVGAGAKGAVAAGRAIGKMFRKSGDDGETSSAEQPLALGYSQPALGYSSSNEKASSINGIRRGGNSSPGAESKVKKHKSTYKRI